MRVTDPAIDEVRVTKEVDVITAGRSRDERNAAGNWWPPRSAIYGSTTNTWYKVLPPSSTNGSLPGLALPIELWSS